MTMELREAGLDVGEHRVGHLMKDNGIRPVRTHRHKVTTDSYHQKWAGDISYIWTAEGWLYLAIRALDMAVRLRNRCPAAFSTPIVAANTVLIISRKNCWPS